MNNNIKETTSLVFVKGKNLFDKSKVVSGYILAQDGSIAAPNNNEASSDFIEINSGNAYTFSVSNYTVPSGGSMWVGIALYDGNKNIIARYADYDIDTMTVTPTQTANAKYLRATYRYNDNNIKCQVEQGSTPTAYKSYVEKQIYIKNENGIFEEFYDEVDIPSCIKSKRVSGTPDSNGFLSAELGLNNIIIGVSNISAAAGFFTPFIEKNANRLTIKCETWQRQAITTQISFTIHYIPLS